ncbi:MAG TPA: hypothetical protein VF591_20790 [Pyrinomonadaceae bacterium]|jgi:hypothetical protein
MKNVIRLLVFAALVTVFALPSYAQDAAAAQTPAAGPCTTEAEAKGALYQKFLASYKGTPEQQKAAAETGREYLGKYGTCPDEADKKVAAFIQNWVNKYDAAAADFIWKKAVNENPAEAFRLGRERTAKNPDDLTTYLQLVVAGLKSAQGGNKSLYAETANAARKALQLIEQGKTSDIWLPYNSQQEAAPGLHYHLGYLTLENAPGEAATHLVKAAQSTSTYSKEPSTYDFLALAYYKNEFTPLAAEYKSKCEGKDATPECDALFNKINAVTHRIVDAYARSVALSPANDAKAKEDRRSKLSTFYKQLHEGSETGMNELVAGILAKPVMLPGQEPQPPASATSTAAGANGTGGAATTPATPAAGTTPPAKPAATPTPATKPAPASPKPPRS